MEEDTSSDEDDNESTTTDMLDKNLARQKSKSTSLEEVPQLDNEEGTQSSVDVNIEDRSRTPQHLGQQNDPSQLSTYISPADFEDHVNEDLFDSLSAVFQSYRS